MLLRTDVLTDMRKAEQGATAIPSATASLLAKISMRKIPVQSFIKREIRNYRLDFRKAYRLKQAA